MFGNKTKPGLIMQAIAEAKSQNTYYKNPEENHDDTNNHGSQLSLEEESEENDYPDIEDLPIILDALRNLSDVKTARARKRDLGLPPSKREKFKEVSKRDGEMLLKFIEENIDPNHKALNLLELDRNHKDSALRVIKFEDFDLPMPVSELLHPDNDFQREVILSMIKAKVATFERVEEVDFWFDLLNGQKDYPKIFSKVDDIKGTLAKIETDLAAALEDIESRREELEAAGKNVSEMKGKVVVHWLQILHYYGVIIAKKDMKPCSNPIPKDATDNDADNVYALMIIGKNICNRRIISNQEREGLLKSFEPGLQSIIDFFILYPRSRKIITYLSEALEIEEELYTNPRQLAQKGNQDQTVNQDAEDESTNGKDNDNQQSQDSVISVIMPTENEPAANGSKSNGNSKPVRRRVANNEL